uniref:Uncharacterized protein n=1 Tax=Chrysotila carterae TaxID=13221 RepID=A0A7S4AZV4_CHRCT
MTSAATHLRVGSHGQQNQNRVTNVVFFATHTTARDDSRLIRHYSQKMRRDASLHAEAWTLLYEDSGKKEGHGYLDLHAWENYTDARLFVWNEAKLFDLFSALPVALASIPGVSQTKNIYLKRYFYFHASLLLWNTSHGQEYPHLRYWWRLELDVVFPMGIGMVIRTASLQNADVLLPKLIPASKNTQYQHFQKNTAWLSNISRALWTWSLVSIGRYSSRFLRDIMRPQWQSGQIAYEEIALPTSCMISKWCEVRSFSNISHPHLNMSNFRFRPEHACQDFLQSVLSTNKFEIWHPLKNRSCYTNYLEKFDK